MKSQIVIVIETPIYPQTKIKIITSLTSDSQTPFPFRGNLIQYRKNNYNRSYQVTLDP